ncbi:MAG: YbaB/EbfC family nucleoid-associated protein [SAR324 cluster bacterium]|nr:YbaB/EbfC family nucleoid-associated protein [SAR324 cluster bacterium]
MFDMGELLKKAQELSQTMQSQQEELAHKTVNVSVGGDMVRMTFNGKQEVKAITIDPEVVDPNDITTLQDLIMSAINEGVRQSQKLAQDSLGQQLGNLAGIKIPGINS